MNWRQLFDWMVSHQNARIECRWIGHARVLYRRFGRFSWSMDFKTLYKIVIIHQELLWRFDKETDVSSVIERDFWRIRHCISSIEIILIQLIRLIDKNCEIAFTGCPYLIFDRHHPIVGEYFAGNKIHVFCMFFPQTTDYVADYNWSLGLSWIGVFRLNDDSSQNKLAISSFY